MARMTIGTFNAENLFLRYRLLDRERVTTGAKVDKAKFVAEGGTILMMRPDLEQFGMVSVTQRDNTARVIWENAPDVVCLQEVENLEAVKQFNSRFLKKRRFTGLALMDGNDNREIDVAVMSKREIVAVRTHMFRKRSDGRPVFPRDCLEVTIDAGGGKTLALFVNHLTSQLSDKTGAKRKRQCEEVHRILVERYGPDLKGDFAVCGDFNDSPDAACLAPLLGAGLENTLNRLPPAERWTYVYKKKRQQLDYILLSPSLAAKSAGLPPYVERRGLSQAIPWDGARFDTVKGDGTEASDHCALFATVEV